MIVRVGHVLCRYLAQGREDETNYGHFHTNFSEYVSSTVELYIEQGASRCHCHRWRQDPGSAALKSGQSQQIPTAWVFRGWL